MTATITRRTFLAAAGVAAALARLRAASPWPIGVESYCFHDVDFAATIARTKQLGLTAIELHDGHLPRDSPPATLASAKQALSAAGELPDELGVEADVEVERPVAIMTAPDGELHHEDPRRGGDAEDGETGLVAEALDQSLGSGLH